MAFIGRDDHLIDPARTHVGGGLAALNTKRLPTDALAATDFAYLLTGANDDYLYVGGIVGPSLAENVSDIPNAHTLAIRSALASSGAGGNLGVFQLGDYYALTGIDHGWWHNTTGVSKTVHVENAFAFGGYTMGCRVIVTTDDPSTVGLSNPGADAAAIGATTLAIASGAGSSVATIVVPNGSYLYIVQIDEGISWGGSSGQALYLKDAGGVTLARVAIWPSPSAGTYNVAWKSPVLLTGGTALPAITPAWLWPAFETIYVPNGYYLYVLQIDYDIVWQGATDQFLDLQDDVTGTLGRISFWASQGSGHFIEQWRSPAFLTGGSDTRPSARWAIGGTRLNVFLNGGVSGVDHGWWRNTSGAGKHVRVINGFPLSGYSMSAGLFVSAIDPANIAP